jgi:CRP-like cAMP-binding protein
MEITDILGNSELFGGIEKKYLEEIAHLCHSQHYAKGETIFNERDKAEYLYILTDGNLALEREVKQESTSQTWATILEVIGKGEGFGWSTMVEPHTFTASSRCITDCEVLAIKGEKLRELMDGEPKLGYELSKRFANLISRKVNYARASLTKSLSQIRLAEEMPGIA